MAEPKVEQRTASIEAVADEGRLAQFGYKQELKRDWGLAHNFGVSFSIIVSTLTCLLHTLLGSKAQRVI